MGKKNFAAFFLEKLPSPNIVEIYSEMVKEEKNNLKVLKLHGKRGDYFISKTLLGYMVGKSGYKIACKDINEAKIIKVLSQLGLKEALIPEKVKKDYAEKFEEKYLELEQKIREVFPLSLKRRLKKKYKSKIYKKIRSEMERII